MHGAGVDHTVTGCQGIGIRGSAHGRWRRRQVLGRIGDELLPAALAAEHKDLVLEFVTQRRDPIHLHSANRIACHRRASRVATAVAHGPILRAQAEGAATAA
ncbi:hypothetical protein WQQ_41610 [Hydrocarboniphaga effusa AP103]|uniref:Uncharacterized protein n=1 Tax=Hydrocarboniphaga effusa AP103 TaxID=1172194 RepID=I8HWK9_9GAMM|nr:hypothetical protein WQQ_41610 [Hydrocarboniphaga effusa AP103]